MIIHIPNMDSNISKEEWIYINCLVVSTFGNILGTSDLTRNGYDVQVFRYKSAYPAAYAIVERMSPEDRVTYLSDKIKQIKKSVDEIDTLLA